MYSRAQILFFVIFAASHAYANSSHLGNLGEAIQSEFAQVSANPYGTIEMPTGSKDAGDLLPVKGALQTVGSDRSRSFRAFLFATGPGLQLTTDEIISLIKEKVPSPIILKLSKFTLDRLGKVVDSLGREGSSVHLTVIVNAEASSVGSELVFLGAEGAILERDFTVALKGAQKKLGVKAITFEPGQSMGRIKIETVLLTSFSARAQCERYPAGVFGVTGPQSARSLARIEKWISKERREAGALFPGDVLGWFESWAASSIRSPVNVANRDEPESNSYWHCSPEHPGKISRDEWW